MHANPRWRIGPSDSYSAIDSCLYPLRHSHSASTFVEQTKSTFLLTIIDLKPSIFKGECYIRSQKDKVNQYRGFSQNNYN